MEQILLQIFSQNGIIVFLFASSFIALLYKWLPYIVDKVFTLFSDMISTQHAFFKEELEKISSAFISQVENSNRWHDSHDRKLEEIHADVKEIKARK